MNEPSQDPGRFAWLLSSAGSTPASPDPLEFAKACEFALSSWQVLPAIGERLLAWGGERLVQDHYAQRIRDRLVSLHVLGDIQLRLCARLIKGFQEYHIPYAMLKGSAVRFSAYPDPRQRMGKDFDVAVPRRYLRQAQQVAHDCGFLAAQWSPSEKKFHVADPVLRAMVEAEHYELGFLVRRQVPDHLTSEQDAAIRRDMESQFIWHLTDDNETACYVSIDIHHGLSLEIDVEKLVEQASSVRSNGLVVQVPPLEWTLFHLIYKIYWEGVHHYGKGAYQFADLARLVPSTSESTFERLVQILAKCRLEVAGYFVLRRLSQNLGLSLQPELERFLELTARPPLDRDPLQVNDLGDMWPKIWGAR